jgi:hypothetical protein
MKSATAASEGELMSTEAERARTAIPAGSFEDDIT